MLIVLTGKTCAQPDPCTAVTCAHCRSPVPWDSGEKGVAENHPLFFPAQPLCPQGLHHLSLMEAFELLS